MKRIFVVDWFLIPFSILTVFSGFKLHIAGHDDVHELWHNWAVFHVVTSVLFLVTTILHITMHWGWYKSWFKSGIGRKSKVTKVLSILFIIVTVTGFVLLFAVNGANSVIGRWHYILGVAMGVISLFHILKRLPILRKSLQK